MKKRKKTTPNTLNMPEYFGKVKYYTDRFGRVSEIEASNGTFRIMNHDTIKSLLTSPPR